MRNNDEKIPKKRKKSLVKRFLRMVVSLVLCFIIIMGSVLFVYSKISNKRLADIVSDSDSNIPNFLGALFGKDIKLNVAVFGVDDDGTRTDVMFVVHFDSKKGELSLISIPRDTKIVMTDTIQSGLKENNRYVPYGGVCKINAVHAYGGSEQGCDYAVMQLEDLLGISIDHYVKVDLEGFRELVDAIGGVEVDVPQDMYYVDPYQDLYINLKAGVQTLDGDMAEQLVRFRKYATGDEGRIEVQQLFLKALMKKVLSSKTILSNLSTLVTTYFDYVTTDITLADALKYVNYINDINMDNISMETLPGTGQYVGDVSYFIHDTEETQKLVEKFFYGKGDTEAKSSVDKKISVLNGGDISGLAKSKSEMLTEAGFNVTNYDNYEGDKTNSTRIIVGEKGVGEDLITYFENAEVIVAPDKLYEEAEITVILGTSES